MSFKDVHDVSISNSSITDVQGDINNYNVQLESEPEPEPETGTYTCAFEKVCDLGSPFQGIIQLRDNICGEALHNSLERHPPPRCHPDTRKAVLTSIIRWIEAPQAGQGNVILWLYGPAGAGKSAIAQTIAERCTLTQKLAASFFFSYGKPGQDTGNHLWATIAYQIAISTPQLRTKINNAVASDPAIFYKCREEQLRKLIVESYSSQTDSESDIPKMPSLVIIDGLDECTSEKVQSELLLSIAEAVNFYHLPLRFLIASRPEPHICQTFDSDNVRNMCYPISLDSKFEPVSDVRVFLRKEFDRIYEKHSRILMASIRAPWPSNAIVDLLAKRSGGQFIYAATVIKFIDDEDCHPADQLAIVLDQSRPTAFTDLDQLYQTVLSKCHNIPLLLRILGCILLSGAPLSATVIERLLELRKGDVHLTLRRMHSILHVPYSSTQPITTLHASLPDFIFNEDRADKYYICRTQCHLDISRACLKFAQLWSADLKGTW
jgi:NACHT domain